MISSNVDFRQLHQSRVILLILWLLTSVGLTLMLSAGVANTGGQTIVRLLQLVYVASLCWHLHRSGPSMRSLPEITAQHFPRRSYGPWIPIGIAVVLLLNLGSNDGSDILFLLLVLATFSGLIVWWRQIRLRLVIQGVAIGLVAYLAGLPTARNDMISEFVLILFSVLACPMYITGVILVKRTKLGGVKVATGNFRGSAKSFLWGFLLFLPLGLINIADGLPDIDTSWVSEWWLPFSLPWFSGLVEEILWRLFALSLCYFLLRLTFKTSPGIALWAAVLFNGIAFGLFHGYSMDKLLTTGMLYGVPMAVVFVKRDWEHAVGAHYMVNFPSWLVSYLANR